MNYKQMLDQFEFLESKLAHLENETKYLKERVTYLEGSFLAAKKPIPPGFTPGTLPEAWPNIPPSQYWTSTETTYSGARQ